MTPEQDQLRDTTVNCLLSVPIENRPLFWGWIERHYVESLRKGWPDLSDDEVQMNLANYTIAVASRLMQIEVTSGSGTVGHG